MSGTVFGSMAELLFIHSVNSITLYFTLSYHSVFINHPVVFLFRQPTSGLERARSLNFNHPVFFPVFVIPPAFIITLQVFLRVFWFLKSKSRFEGALYLFSIWQRCRYIHQLFKFVTSFIIRPISFYRFYPSTNQFTVWVAGPGSLLPLHPSS